MGGRLGMGFSAPGDVRYVISCRHLDRQHLFPAASRLKEGWKGMVGNALFEIFSTSSSTLWISWDRTNILPWAGVRAFC